MRTALDLGIFDAIVQAGKLGISNDNLAYKVGADSELVRKCFDSAGPR